MIRRNAQCTRRSRQGTAIRRGNILKFAAAGLGGYWNSDPRQITLNGTDASQIRDVSKNARHVSQGSGANQPLYTGAPTYRGKTCVQFTAANSDNLVSASVNIVGTGPVTLISVHAYRANAAGQHIIFANTSASGGVALSANNATITRIVMDNGLANHTGSNMPASTLEIWVMRQAAAAVPTLLVNGVTDTLADSTTGITSPGASAGVGIGTGPGIGTFCDADWLASAIVTAVLSDSVVARINHALGALYGVAA